ncbi:LysR family transcriptional regulator [Caballeronia sp. S22]|uniref:LysR family transcriptional regulator n=1 Tax=Caballeronia sp. S22 TaxID=3137182 RepID=UPI0035313EEE
MIDKERFSGLHEFVLSAQAGSFTAAGLQLGLTSSAVGKAVTRLEERLGTKYPSAQPVLSVRVHDAKVSASW